MAVSMKQTSCIVATLGVLSFMFGIIAENKKPASGIPITGKGVVICKYPSDPTVALGYISFAFLVASSAAGYLSLFYPYRGKSVPQSALFRSTSFTVFFNIALFTGGLAAALLLWPTLTEQLHLSRKVHHNLETECPTAKTGLLGGGAFVSLDSALFWLVSLMLADNAREDYFDEVDGNGDNGQVTADDYDAPGYEASEFVQHFTDLPISHNLAAVAPKATVRAYPIELASLNFQGPQQQMMAAKRRAVYKSQVSDLTSRQPPKTDLGHLCPMTCDSS